MPFYRYECGKCHSEFRLLRRNDDEEPAICPHCGSAKTNRLLPRIGVIYKGNGYYSTDYKKTKRTGSSGSGSSEPSSAAAE
jgi:putative FmdB family regulatory protein